MHAKIIKLHSVHCKYNSDLHLWLDRRSVVDWIGLAQDRYRRKALVNVEMNLWVA
jgi:hypothetical protein